MIDIKNLKVDIENKVLRSKRVVIVPHNVEKNNVDFDGIGSAIGLSLIPRKMDRESIIVSTDSLYGVDPGVRMIIEKNKKKYNIINSEKYGKIHDEDDLFILTDVNKTYLVNIDKYLTNPDNIIIIDHHNGDKDTVKSNSVYIDTNSSSASEVVVELLKEWNIEIPKLVANYLYAGISLDTARLTKNCTKNTMYSAAELLASGADINVVNEFFKEDFLSDRRISKLINKTKIYNIMIGVIAAEEDEEYTRIELAKAADHVLKFGADASFAIGKLENGSVAVSARATGKINVGSIMEVLGGGGHPYSAYAGIDNENVKNVEKRLTKQLKPFYYIEEKKD
jgi:c-di-AMP phosphodiesterase-like protein